MRLRPLGRTGLTVSSLVLGTDNFANPTPEPECAAILQRAIDGGITLIDTSNSYTAGESERIIGRALKASGRRHQVMIATKVFYPTGDQLDDRGLSRGAITKACDASLARLQVDCIDLYQAHRPDPEVPLEETLRAFDDMVRQGKVRFVGSTTAPAWHVVESVMTSRNLGLTAIVSEQSPYNLLDRRVENELLPACHRHGLAVFTWSPLAMGMLAGRYTVGAGAPVDSRSALRGSIYAERVTARGVAAGNAFATMAREHGLDPAQAALAWVRDQPGVTAPIIGPRTLAQLEVMLAADAVTLPATLRDACNAITPPGGVTASFFNTAAWMAERVV